MRTFLLICTAATFTLPAYAMTREQRNALNHIAQATVIQDTCAEYTINDELATRLTLRYKINFIDGATYSLFHSLYNQHKSGMEAAGQKIGCLIGWSLYGTGGENVPGLIRRKG